MKMLVIRNYWLMIISWCLFLNGKEILGILIGAIGCIYLLLFKDSINCYRILLIGFLMFVISCLILIPSNIPYFFSKLHILLMVISIDTAITNEYLYLFKNKFILPILLICLSTIIISSLLIIVLPDSLYSLFTKASLFKMLAFIFLPYLLPLAYAAIRNAFKYKEVNFFQKQGAIN